MTTEAATRDRRHRQVHRERVWTVVTDPQRGRVLTFVIVAGLGAPAVTGALDLYLRTHTP